MRLTAADIKEHYGVDRRTVTNWLNEKPPCPSTLEKSGRVFDSVAVARWWAERAARKAVAAGKAAEPEGSFAERRAAAEARTAEIAAARAQLALERELGEVVSVADYETALGTVLDRLTARLRAMPVRLSHFGADVELAAESEVERLVVQLNAWDDDVIEEADPEPPPSAGIAA